jgi:hypothetical protein
MDAAEEKAFYHWMKSNLEWPDAHHVIRDLHQMNYSSDRAEYIMELQLYRENYKKKAKKQWNGRLSQVCCRFHKYTK